MYSFKPQFPSRVRNAGLLGKQKQLVLTPYLIREWCLNLPSGIKRFKIFVELFERFVQASVTIK